MILFRITGGELIPEIQMPSFKTILELKQSIEEHLGVEVARQTLWFESFELIKLENDRLIEYYPFDNQFATLNLSVTPLSGQPKFTITVRSSGREDLIRVRETQTVADLRRKVERLLGIPPENMTLFRLEKEMDYYHPLSAYYIGQGSIVDVTITIKPR